MHHHKIRLRLDRNKSRNTRQSNVQTITLGTNSLDQRLKFRLEYLNRNFAGNLRKGVEVIRQHGFRYLPNQLRRSKEVTNAQGRHRHRLGERAQHNEVFVITEKFHRGMTGKLVVRLIDNDQTTSRFQYHDQLLIADHAAGGIIRRTNDRDIWLLFLNLFKQRCHVKLKITAERNSHDFTAEDCRDLPVECKGRLGNKNALPLPNGDHQKRLNQFVRTVARDNSIRLISAERACASRPSAAARAAILPAERLIASFE